MKYHHGRYPWNARLFDSSWPDYRHVTQFQWKTHEPSVAFTFVTLVSDRQRSRVIIVCRSSVRPRFPFRYNTQRYSAARHACVLLRSLESYRASGTRLTTTMTGRSLWGFPGLSYKKSVVSFRSRSITISGVLFFDQQRRIFKILKCWEFENLNF